MPENTPAENASVANEPAAERRVIAVIDGNSLMHRAFHAIRQPMSAVRRTRCSASSTCS